VEVQVSSEDTREQGPRRVVIVDHQSASANRLRLALARPEEFECVGLACTAAQALALVERATPDLVVVDLMLRGSTGLALVRRLRAAYGELAIVVTSASPDLSKLMAAAVAGANGVAPRSGAAEELLSVLRSAHPGGMSIAPSLLPATGPGSPNPRPGRLSARESHVLELMSRGATALEVARVLSISVATSRHHIRTIRGKLGARTQQEAVGRAQRIGLLEPAR
jgi:DNA-binding NarL/FixJ family response regulator